MASLKDLFSTMIAKINSKVASVNGSIPDENGNVDVSGLPDGGGSNKQLVTDAEGNTVWEDRLAYDGGTVEVQILDTVTASWSRSELPGLFFDNVYGRITIVPNNTYRLVGTVFAYGSEIDVDLTCTATISEFIDFPAITHEYGDFYISVATDSMTIVDYNAGGSFSLSLYGYESNIVQLPDKFIPDAIARVEDIPDAVGAVGTGANSEIFNDYSGNTAGGQYAHAEGINTIAASNYQHAQGKFNIEDTASTYAHIVGNGSSTSARSNAHTIDWDGNAWFAGDVYVGSTSGKDKDDGSKKLATEDYVNGGTIIL